MILVQAMDIGFERILPARAATIRSSLSHENTSAVRTQASSTISNQLSSFFPFSCSSGMADWVCTLLSDRKGRFACPTLPIPIRPDGLLLRPPAPKYKASGEVGSCPSRAFTGDERGAGGRGRGWAAERTSLDSLIVFDSDDSGLLAVMAEVKVRSGALARIACMESLHSPQL